MAKNLQVSLDSAWFEYLDAKALKSTELYSSEWDLENFQCSCNGWPEDDTDWQVEACWAEYNASMNCPGGSPSDDYWCYLCHKRCTSWVEVWEMLETCEEFEAWEELWDLGSDEELAPLFLEMEQATTPTSRRASRLRKALSHKQRVLRNADVAAKAYRKWNFEDLMNGFYCRRRGGHEVHMPKPLGLKAIKLQKRAAKLHA